MKKARSGGLFRGAVLTAQKLNLTASSTELVSLAGF